ncbi:MAG: sulfatase-like hydrolase/transferase [Anaerolineae bacterium]|nr:sulfatase-like hydrolase/transferase [Anaerolineae bacterium]
MTARPNVIWIFGDQHRGQALGCEGDPNVQTPVLDEMAASGVRFTNAASGCPLCTPFRGSLITSRYIHHCVQRTPQHMDPELPVVTDVLNDHGYLTAYFGKWHLGGANRMIHVPREERGRFDIWLGYENINAQYDCWIHGHDLDGRDDAEPLTEKLEQYETDALTNRLIDFIRRYRDAQPFLPCSRSSRRTIPTWHRRSMRHATPLKISSCARMCRTSRGSQNDRVRIWQATTLRLRISIGMWGVSWRRCRSRASTRILT